jgi:hypothetical protein
VAYDEKLATRIRQALARRRGVAEKKMFGGLCFLVDGARCCGVLHGELIVRLGAGDFTRAVAGPYARPFDFTGRASKSMVYVAPGGVRTAKALEQWVARGVSEARRKNAAAR